MITISIKSTFPEVARALQRLPDEVANPAMARTLNRTVEQGRTQMARDISREYNLSYSTTRARLRITRARATRSQLMLRATLDAKGKHGMNLIHFVERSVSLAEGRRRAKTGTLGHVGFRIKRGGGTQFIRGPRAAFIANAGRTLFRRMGKTRLPIEPVTTIDVPAMFSAQRINNAVRAVMLARFPAVFAREARFFLDRWRAR